ncbi:zinc finger swim domain-containing protein 6- hypothetical protein [Limosa lapponica baueri]|uniref:Uncharacterized protein n=1 Tax=Limosa lapponica baueri TaxID=1758121 RepID=A0A2I0TIL9_LIMLA|nr:zinc finger swim domain-containing protein 6- hypothetical protein [Limosa lapponica baueri]
MEIPICQPDLSSKEVCCLLGAWIQDAVARQSRLDRLYSPLLLFHVGTNDTARGDPESIKHDYVALGAMVKGIEAQVVFSSILLEEVDEAFFRQLEEASLLQALVLVVDWNHPNICWRDNTAGHKQSKRFLECIDDNFVMQVIEDLM